MAKPRRANRTEQKAEAEIMGGGAAEDSPQSRSVRPPAGARRRAYDAAGPEVLGNLETAAKTANAQLASVEAADRRYQDALAAYDAALAEPPARTKAQRERQAEAVKAAEKRYEIARKNLLDMRRVVTTNAALASVLTKVGKVSHDAQLGEKIGRMRVAGVESARKAMLAPQAADDATVH